ncbi:MAG TPA: penicillin-binding transpeptidase domain-containing protein [Clostridia bacterium]|nr:penicillin-binding transpeptidase domain-containing protein [Clostridia bacterium]
MATGLLITFLFVAVIARLLYIQVVAGKSMQIKALDQWTRDVPITGERGDIFDVNGVVLADTQTLYTVYVRPVSVKNKDYTARILGSVLGIDSEKLLQRMNSKVSEITVAKKVNKEQMKLLVESEVTGVYFSQNLQRVYPYGDFMTQILGFTNVDGMGQSGAEAYYSNYLKGIDGYILTETDLVGRELETNVTRYIEGSKGNSIYLTLDYAIQEITENAVRDAFTRFQAKSVSCIVMNAKTGSVLAMAQQPSYDLNNIPRDNVAELFALSNSLLVSSVYEPGSTFKVLTAAAGLETGAITTKHHVYCPGYRMVDGKKIKCWRTIGHGSQTFAQGVQNSCNCLFMDIAQKVGAKRFYQYLELFGVTEKTGIDMSGEASGLTIALENVKNVDIARMGFGQAIAITPIELVTACASVVNGGKLMTPYILDKVVDKDGKIIVQNYPIVRRNTISKETSAIMREILESVVTEGGGKNARVEGYRIGGKTGTAQKYENGAIAHGKYVSTFMGFAPADDPEYIMLFIVDEPKGYMYYGSLVAAPYASQIFANIFSYKGIAPANVTQKETFLMPDLMGMSLTEAVKTLKKLGMYYELSGEDGLVTYQFPVPGSIVTADNVALIEANRS